MTKKFKIILASVVLVLIVIVGISFILIKTGELTGLADYVLPNKYPNISLTFSDGSYLKGEPVIFYLKNNGGSNVTLKNSAPWVIQNSSKVTIFAPIATQSTITLKPGETQKWTWNQKDNNKKQMVVGAYSVLLLNVRGNFSISNSKTINESFESGFNGWGSDHYLNCEQATIPCSPLVWKIDRSTVQAKDGQYSLTYYLNGTHDDGQIWVERSFAVPANTKLNVSLNFNLWSTHVSNINQWDTITYMGTTNPKIWSLNSNFKLTGKTDQIAGWKKYSDTRTIQTDNSGKVWLAFGIWANSEVSRTYHIDSATVSIAIPSASINF